MENEREEIRINEQNNHINKNSNKQIIIFFQFTFLIFFVLLVVLQIIVIKKKNFIIINENKKDNKSEDKISNLEEKIRQLKIITNNDKNEYQGLLNCLINNPDNEHCIYHLICPKAVLGKKRIIVGKWSDGCYILLDDFKNIRVAYSFGISINIQFDKALADKGIDVFMYDHTIDSLPYENPKFHWKKIGLCGKNTKNKYLKNLEELIEENGHNNERDMILKIDIEHWEWESIIDLKEDTLNKFKYIAIEYHFKDEKEFKNDNLYYNVLKKISQTHQVVYIRCNENRSNKINFGNNRICHIIEVTYVIKKDNIFMNDKEIYPLYELDYKKPVPGRLEMNLNVLKLFDK